MKHILVFRQVTILLLAAMLAACTQGGGTEDNPKPLNKSDAMKLLGFMGYQNATIAGIVPEAGGMGSSRNVATVFGIGVQNGSTQRIEVIFTYDKDIGWFYHEFDGNPGGGARDTKLRLWTIEGYKELVPIRTP